MWYCGIQSARWTSWKPWPGWKLATATAARASAARAVTSAAGFAAGRGRKATIAPPSSGPSQISVSISTDGSADHHEHQSDHGAARQHEHVVAEVAVLRQREVGRAFLSGGADSEHGAVDDRLLDPAVERAAQPVHRPHERGVVDLVKPVLALEQRLQPRV